ncbi:MAG: hypothetical protein WBC74_00195 [Candidatus Omnitrophota bacterium]
MAKISTFLENLKNRKAAEDILEESKFFIEWTAQEASLEVQAVLSEIQLKLALWQRHLAQKRENVREIEEVKNATKAWSNNLLEISGILTG